MSNIAMNYFEYQDFPKIDRSQIVISTSLELQTGSNVEQLKDGVMPYEYASFQKDDYVTSEPKKLAPLNPMLGLVSKEISNEQGAISNMQINIDLPEKISFTGVSLGFLNLPEIVVINYFNDDLRVGIKQFTVTEKKEFFEFKATSVNRVVIILNHTQEPRHFWIVNRIDLGELKIFDASNLVDVNITTHFDVDGSTIQYDVAELTIFTGENNNEYLFQKKQPVIYKDANGNTLHKFYIENGENNDDATANLTAYDSISLLEDEYLGGIYGFDIDGFFEAPTITYQALIDDILKNTGVEYEIEESIKTLEIKGYIPICTRRKALAIVCKGTNTRIFKTNGVLMFKDIESTNNVTYTKNQVAENPEIQSESRVSKVTVLEHEYQKETEPVELYNWYLRQSLDGEDTMQMLKFSEPVYRIEAYEVIGTDDSGIDEVSENQSTSVSFYHAPISGGSEDGDENVCNYCIIAKCFTDRKVVILGYPIKDDMNNNTYYERTDLDSNAEYEEVEIDDVTITTVSGGVKSVAKTLFGIETQRKTQDFSLVEVDRPSVGLAVNTPMVSIPVSIGGKDADGNLEQLNYRLKITEIEDNLSGMYRVVAK